jgi:hypothetical protein
MRLTFKILVENLSSYLQGLYKHKNPFISIYQV